MNYNEPQRKKLEIFKKQNRFTDFLFELVELHNTVSLLADRKKAYKREPNEKNKYWYLETQKALKRLNDDISLHADEYLYLLETLEASTVEKQVLIIDNRISEDRFMITLKYRYLRTKNKAIEFVNRQLEKTAIDRINRKKVKSTAGN